MRQRYDAIRKRWNAFACSRRGLKILRAARIAFIGSIAAYLVWELRDVELSQVARGLPRQPHFYVLLLIVYFILPASQILAYRITWVFRLRNGIPAFIKKRILNKDVLGYSGEVFLYTWASKHIGESPAEIMKTIRDQNILSSAASTMVAIVLVALFVFTGQVTLTELVGERKESTVIVAGIILVIVMMIMGRGWKYMFAMSWRPASMIFCVHVARVLVRTVTEITMWHVAMPEVPLKVWFTYAAVTIIVTRIPFLPAADLAIMSIAVGLSSVMGVTEAHIFALFTAVAVVHRGVNLLFFAVLPALEQSSDAGRRPLRR